MIEAFEALLRTKELVVESAEVVWKALRMVQSSNADLADCLVSCSAVAAGCAKTMTFDRGAVKGAGMTLIT
jgi:predicted nucleic-acid-binding protein